MIAKIALPQDQSALEDWVEQTVKAGKVRRNPQSIKWWLAHWYLRGARNFTNINFQDGSLQVSYLNGEGKLQFVYEDILAQYQTKLGRLMSLNLAPVVKRKGISLDGLRKSSIAQASLDAAFPQSKVKNLQRQIGPPLTTYGTIGLGLWAEDEDSMGIEIIMPWELLPIPADVSNPTEVRGVIRRRYVPLSWVKALQISPGKKSKTYKDMDQTVLPVGQIPNEADGKFEGMSMASTTYGEGFFVKTKNQGLNSGGGNGKDKTEEPVVEFCELWTETTDGYLADYVVVAGGKLVHRASHLQYKFHMPIHIVRDIQVGGFYGRSSIDMLIPINSELENTIGNMFQSAIDFDLYGIFLEPTTLGVDTKAIRGVDGLKRLRYEPDYTMPNLAPTNIAPAKPTDFQMKVVQAGTALVDRLSNQPKELMSGSAPGRVDSSPALGLLYETSSIPLSPTAGSIAEGVAGIYRAMLGYIKNTWKSEKIVDVTHLDDALAGIKFDSGTGEISLAENALPHPDEVDIQVSSELPKSVEQQKMEMQKALELQIITPREYRIEVRKRDLGLPVGNEAEWQNYRRAMIENLVLFGDGEQAGEVIVSDNDMHIVHLEVLDAFMARPEYYAAKEQVRVKFGEHKMAHQAGLGMLPDGMDSMEEAAQAQMGELPPGMLPGMGSPAPMEGMM